MPDEPSALALFKKYQPRFRTVTWEPAGFPCQVGANFTAFAFEPESATRNGYTWYGLPRLDIEEAGLPIDTKDIKQGRFPPRHESMEIWDIIRTQAFGGREFYADPGKDSDAILKRVFKNMAEGFACGDIPIRFSHSGDPIPGLFLPENMTGRWWFFVPEKTPEAAAIKAALRFERAKYLGEHADAANDASLPSLRDLGGMVRDAVAAVPA